MSQGLRGEEKRADSRRLRQRNDGRSPARFGWFLFFTVSLFLGLIAYGGVLRLPFFFDDFVHIQYLDGHSLGEIWRMIEGVAYYRPLNFSIWKLMALLTGSHSPPLQHGLNLALHLANGLLVGWLAGRLWAADNEQTGNGAAETRQWLRRFLSAALFLLYPFSYQAVPWAGSLAHLLVTFLILAALATYILGREGRRGWLLVSLGCTVLAPFAHENGVLLPALLAAFEWSRPAHPRILVVARRVLLWSLPVLGWLLLYLSIPREAGAPPLRGLREVLRSGSYALQGMGYPLAWIGGPLVREGANHFLVAAGLGLLALAIALLFLWRVRPVRMRRRVLFPVIWSGLAVLPTILLLDLRYVYTSPRLLMLASVGVAWLWGDTLAYLLAPGTTEMHRYRGWLQRAAGFVLLIVVVGHSSVFLGERMKEYHLLGQAIEQAVVEVVEANRAGRPAVLVNFPRWIAPAETTYPLGTEGVVILPDYVGPSLLASVHTGEAADIRFLQVEEIRSELPYRVNTAGQGLDWSALEAERVQVIVTRYAADQVQVEAAGGFLPDTPRSKPLASFGEPSPAIHLLSATARQGDDTIEVRLAWSAERTPEEDITVFVHVVDGAGQLITQADGYPVGGTYPFRMFPPGLAVEDIRLIPDAGEGAAVLVGLYRPADGERLPLWENGARLPDNFLRLPLVAAD